MTRVLIWTNPSGYEIALSSVAGYAVRRGERFVSARTKKSGRKVFVPATAVKVVAR